MNGSRWQVIIHCKAERVLKRLDADMLERIRRSIRGLASEPHHDDCEKLTGYENLYRIRVGDWRIITRLKKINSSFSFLQFHRVAAHIAIFSVYTQSQNHGCHPDQPPPHLGGLAIRPTKHDC